MDSFEKHEDGMRVGWLQNYHPTTVAATGVEADEKDLDKEKDGASAIRMFFQDLDGVIFEATMIYNPYFLVATVEGHEREVELGIASAFSTLVSSVQQLNKEDLGMVNHLSGRQKVYLKVTFLNTSNLTAVRAKLETAVKRNQNVSDANPFTEISETTFGYLTETGDSADKLFWMKWIADIREYDVKYHVRVSIDLGMYVGLWYEVNALHGDVSVVRCDDSKYAPAMPSVCAFDIETTKAPLKFPQPEVDQIYMISYMFDGRGYLIVNREIVTDDISPFEYTPRPEYEGCFETFNELDEFHLLTRWYTEMKIKRPSVFVTYNGDYFDFPFIHARSLFHGLNMRQEMGFSQNAEGAFLNRCVPHLDCFYWVKRDSYLPQGSQGLKAVTKAKLGYDPVEVDPEDMLPLAQSKPQQMAAYSVSDAVATFYLYMKYVHPFIFSLCTIIPMPPDEVLRKGSGTLCESLLCVQAFYKNVVFPNKQVAQKEKFFNGHLIDRETYIGGHVEALQSGVFRSDIPLRFRMKPDAYEMLIRELDGMLEYALEVECDVRKSEVTNYEEVRNKIATQLANLRDFPDRMEEPMIYHLDVGAMYPNIILTNRLQPPSMVTPEVCAGCCFYTPDNANKCQREMVWIWRGELFTANRHEYERVKAQLETESFTASTVQKVDASITTKKNYGNRKGNVLEGTTFERKEFKSRQAREKEQRLREAREALLEKSDSGESASEDEDGNRRFNKLKDNTQTQLLKKRVGEYSRKAYGRTHEEREIRKTHTVCQRENSFYVDTVRLFRDRRYHYKRELKKWKGILDKAKDPGEIKIAKGRCIQMESLQLAHKCILNSFYGYVMRRGSRWYSMEMAGIVTYLGATLITMARQLVQQIGVPLELDTDGIWCCLPKSFPENFSFTTSNPKKPSVTISYPCVMLNKDVQDRYTNHQYQDMETTGVYKVHSECSIYFEVDGPYLSMILPASREEGKSIKKRYAVFHPDGRLAELKGFELKRRGELMLIKDFQSQVFRQFLCGSSLEDAYGSAAAIANSALDMLYSKGEGYEEEEVLEKLTESSNMTRKLSEYGENQKSLALTTARRIAEFLGPQMVKDKGLACRFVISKNPPGKTVTERPIPLNIFKAEESVKIHFLRKWTADSSIGSDVSLAQLLDWDYYIQRFNAQVQKIISIPAAFQGVKNPVDRVPLPQWLQKTLQQRNSRFRQGNLDSILVKKKLGIPDIEELGRRARDAQQKDESSDSSDVEVVERELQKAEEQRQLRLAVNELGKEYFAPKSTKAFDSNFFVAKGYQPWLSEKTEQWVKRARLRLELVGSAPDATGSLGLIDIKAKAFNSTWQILEVRASGEPNIVQIFALLDKTLAVLRCIVERNVVVDVLSHELAPPASRKLVGKILPQHRAPSSLVELTVSTQYDTGDAAVQKLRFVDDNVRGVYEADIPLPTRCIWESGCMCTVNTSMHIANVKKRNFAKDAVEIGELEQVNAAGYLTHMKLSTAFIFHAATDSRGIIGVIFAATSHATIVIIQPAAAEQVAPPWNTIIDEALDQFQAPRGKVRVDVTTSFAANSRVAWGIINEALVTASEVPTRPHLAVVESTLPTSTLTRTGFVPHLTYLPIMRVIGAAEDEKLLFTNLLWIRHVSRRLFLRYLSSSAWIDERTSVARVAQVPLCNLLQDTYVGALDIMFSRALRKHGHVLWDRMDPCVAAPPEERPRQVVVAGGYSSWCVEFSISQLDVVAILFSQMIQEGDDPRQHVLCDGGVTTHFHVLRDLLSELYGLAVAKKGDAALAILYNVSRWIRDTMSETYEPNIVGLISGLVHRALATLLIRITKLGGKIVRATSTSVIVATPKHDLSDAVNYASFLVASLKDHPMLNHLALQNVRLWAPFLIYDHHNWAGLAVSAEDALASTQPAAPQIASKMGFAFSLWNQFPKELRELVLVRVGDFLNRVAQVHSEARRAIDSDPSVTLANRGEKLEQMKAQLFNGYIENELQPLMLGEVNEILQARVQLIDGSGGTALEFTKMVCQLFELLPSAVNGVRKIKNNCLRLCGIGPFAPEAQFEDNSGSDILMIPARCSYCNEDAILDFADPNSTEWRCGSCDNTFSRTNIEAHLVVHVQQLIAAHLSQDFVCPKCKQSTKYLLSTSCCSELVPRNNKAARELQFLGAAAKRLSFGWLEETVTQAVSCL